MTVEQVAKIRAGELPTYDLVALCDSWTELLEVIVECEADANTANPTNWVRMTDLISKRCGAVLDAAGRKAC